MRDRSRAAVVALSISVLWLAIPRPALGQCDSARAHRPVEDLFGSDVVYLQEHGEVQLEAKPARVHARGARTTTLEADVEYGLRDWWQIESEWDAREWTSAADGTVTAGAGDIAVGSRLGWRCIRGSPYHLSAGMDLALPSDDVGHARDAGRHVSLSPAVIVGRDVARTTHVFTSIDVDVPLNHRDRGLPPWSYVSDTGMFVRMVQGFRGTIEISVEGRPGEERTVEFMPGVLWHRRDTIELGVAMLRPVKGDAPRGVLAHVVCEFGEKHDRKANSAETRSRPRVHARPALRPPPDRAHAM